MKRPRIEEHHIEVLRTARYFTLGALSSDTQRVWFVCHGYQQLAPDFVRCFDRLDDGRNYVVAPEGLSRFYLDDGSPEHGRDARIGATWMTREDRENEIKDYVAYLDALYARVFNDKDRNDVDVLALGFSQGAATASRWVQQGRAKVDHLILWGGLLPPDLEIGSSSPLQAARLTFVVGEQDTLVPPRAVEEQETRLRRSKVPFESVRFQGGHQLNQFVLSDLAAG